MFFPLFLNSKKTRFLIVGGGNVALAKLETILQFSKKENILLIAKNFSDDLKKFAQDHKITFLQDSYHEKYLRNHDVIISATDSKALNQRVYVDGTKFGKLVNVVDDTQNSHFIFGANAKFGDLILAVSTSAKAPVLARLVKEKFAASLPHNFQDLLDFLDFNKELIRKKFPDLQPRRLFLQELIESEIAQNLLAGNQIAAQKSLETRLGNSLNENRAAVYFIGAGCGDPELITIKGARLLSQADIVLYDRLVAPQILSHARKDALKINVGKTRDFHLFSQDQINQLIRKYVLEGKIVARLKGGDPTLFAQLHSEIDAIKDLQTPYQIVPGITAASGAAAYAGIPLTSRESNKSVRFITLYTENLQDEKYFAELARSSDSLVLYMSSHNLLEVSQKLIAAGKNKSTPLAVIEQATTPFQKVYLSNLSDVAGDFSDKKFVSPSLIIIGEIVLAHQHYRWLEEGKGGEFFQKLKTSKSIKL